jgi:uncharacterized protein YcfJ
MEQFMTHTHAWALAAVAAALCSAPAAAQTYPTNPPANAAEMGRVLSSVPVLTQVAVPRQVCTVEQITRDGQKSGAGALMGGIAGGAMGNAVGDGTGRAVATMIGIVGGAILGNNIEGGGQPQTQQVQNCRTETTYETRTQGYNVTYEYAGKQYTVQMPQDPGAWVPLRVSPVLPGQPSSGTGYSSPVSTAPVFLGPTVITQETTYLQPPVTYVRPSGYVSAPNTQFWLNVSSDRRQPYTTHHHSHGRVNGSYGHATPGRGWDDDRRWR